MQLNKKIYTLVMHDEQLPLIQLIEEVIELVHQKRIPAKECAEHVGRTANWFTCMSRPRENYEKFLIIKAYLEKTPAREKSTRGRKKSSKED